MLWLSCGKVRWQLAVAKVIPWTPSDQMFFTAFLGNLWLITKHVFRFTMQNLIDYLVGHCLPLRQFPCPDFFWYLCHGHCWNLSYEGLHDLPQPEGEFSEKGTSQHVDGKADLFGLMHWGHLCKGRDSSKGTVCRSGKASCQECADLRSPTGAWVEALKCNTMLIISRY